MNPIALFTQIFGKSVPFLLIPQFLYHFYVKFDQTGDITEALIYAAKKTLLPI